jgi:DNA-binding phage protein
MEYLEMLGRLLRAAGRRVADADEPELARLLQVRNEVDAAIIAAIQGQRARGRSWAAIAAATGTTRQAAHEKWSRR